MKKQKKNKQRLHSPMIGDKPIEGVEAVSSTEMTGLYPTPPEDESEEQAYEDVYPGTEK